MDELFDLFGQAEVFDPAPDGSMDETDGGDHARHHATGLFDACAGAVTQGGFFCQPVDGLEMFLDFPGYLLGLANGSGCRSKG